MNQECNLSPDVSRTRIVHLLLLASPDSRKRREGHFSRSTFAQFIRYPTYISQPQSNNTVT